MANSEHKLPLRSPPSYEIAHLDDVTGAGLGAADGSSALAPHLWWLSDGE